MWLESKEYIFVSPHSTDQCLKYLKEYSTVFPNWIELRGMHLRGTSRTWGNKFRLSIYPWLSNGFFQCFFGEIIPQEKGCLIKGKFKFRWMFLVVPIILISIFVDYAGSGHGHFVFSEFIFMVFFYLAFFVGAFTLSFKLNLFGIYKDKYLVEFVKTAFDAEFKENR